MKGFFKRLGLRLSRRLGTTFAGLLAGTGLVLTPEQMATLEGAAVILVGVAVDIAADVIRGG
jgi:hypothetical protein